MTSDTNRDELLSDALRLADDLIDVVFMALGSLIMVRLRQDHGRPLTTEQLTIRIEDVSRARGKAIERYCQLMNDAYPPKVGDQQMIVIGGGWGRILRQPDLAQAVDGMRVYMALQKQRLISISAENSGRPHDGGLEWCDDGLQISIEWEREEAAALVGKDLVLELKDGGGYAAFTVSEGGKVNAVGGIQNLRLTEIDVSAEATADSLRVACQP